MEELDLARCKRISDEAVSHIISLRGLKKLGLAETGVGATGMSLLPVLSSLHTVPAWPIQHKISHFVRCQIM